MINWFKKLFRIVRHYDENQAHVYEQMDAIQKVVVARTTTNVDVNYNGYDHIILIGHYKGRDYIECKAVGKSDFNHLVEQLKEMHKLSRLDIVDSWPNFRAVISRELNR